MKPTNCAHIDKCSAPLCPLDPDIKIYSWYPYEEICNSRIHGKDKAFIKIQRRIAKKTNCSTTTGFFTIDYMKKRLTQNMLKGIDFDKINRNTTLRSRVMNPSHLITLQEARDSKSTKKIGPQEKP